MSAIAGVIAWGGGDAFAEQACRTLVRALEPYGPHATHVAASAGAAVARCLYRTLAEDDFDAQPWSGASGRLYVGDVRIDNREEVGAALGLAARRLPHAADANLLFLAWERWGEAVSDRVEGDFAAARWDGGRGRMTLIRSALSMKPLYMAATAELFAFSIMPEALTNLPEVGREPDLDVLARVVTLAPRHRFSTAYSRIERVPPGQRVEVARDGVTRRPIWDPPSEPVSGRSVKEAGGQMRELLDRATLACTRRAGGKVATHLSGGRDSSAVTASAACAARSGAVLALTGAPREAFAGEVFADWTADETSAAQATAAMHPNIVHRVCRHAGTFDLDELERVQAADQRPLCQPSQLPWRLATSGVAASEGASVLLTGSLGNLTISSGGERFLRDVLRLQGPAAWLRHAARTAGSSWPVWRSVLHGAIGPALPPPLYRLIRSAAGRGTAISLPILQQPYRHAAEQAFAAIDDARPRSALQQRRKMLIARDEAEKTSLRLWGIDVRDPTANKRLAEFCLTLPPEQLVDGRLGRPVFDEAFRDRLPAQVLRPARRGYQQADWYELFKPSDIRERFAAYAAEPAVAELIDLDFVRDLVHRWPASGWDRWEQVQLYRDHLLTALAVSAFLYRLGRPR